MTQSSALTLDPAPRSARLSIAFAYSLRLPDGMISIYRPRAGEQFDPLPVARLTLVQGFFPDHAALTGAGYQVSVTPSPAPVALICLPRSKTEGLGLIAEAVRLGARLVLVDGQKTDGVESVLKAVREKVSVAGTVSKAHGKLFWFAPDGADFVDWALEPHRVSDATLGTFKTIAGVFSVAEVDTGSQLLAAHLPRSLPARMADLGAGWGYLSAACLARDGVEQMHLVEAEAAALDLARANVSDPRAQFHWADATQFTLPEVLDGVVMNPPFHTGRKPQPALGLAFITAAARMLKGRGQLWMVANRHLPYEGALADLFGQHELLVETGTFRLWHASNPRTRGGKTITKQKRQGHSR